MQQRRCMYELDECSGLDVGAAFVPALVPILPPAPGRLSTMKGCPMDFAIRSSRMRMTTSLALPPAKGTMTWMGRVG